MPRLRFFFLVLGNARTGSTLLGAILNAHPALVCANESRSSFELWRNLSRQAILEDLYSNAVTVRQGGLQPSGYRYPIDVPHSSPERLLGIGDKVWNPATLMLHGDASLLGHLRSLLGLNILLIEVVRNPFDVIATMHIRSGASLENRANWYRMHCDAASSIRKSVPENQFIRIHYEDLIASPGDTIKEICDFLGVESDESHIRACLKLIYKDPKMTRQQVKWTPSDEDVVMKTIQVYKHLMRYGDASSFPQGS